MSHKVYNLNFVLDVAVNNCFILFCIQVLFKDGVFQWKRLENLIVLAKENVAKMNSNPALKVKSTYVILISC